MKWMIFAVWMASILFIHFRGKVRLPFIRQLLDYSILFAPINAFMIICSRVSTKPFILVSEIPELCILREQWQTFREEALALVQQGHVKVAEKHNDIGFNSFFKYGWKRFYLKWYGAKHPSAHSLCPKTVAILNGLPKVKAAMFAELPAGSQLNLHRDPFAGSLRYHLGLLTPNHNDCSIVVDGEAYSWHDGEDVIFDETYLHHAFNRTTSNRIILFCDIERPLKWRWAQSFNHWFGRVVVSAASSPNQAEDKTGFINRLTHYHWLIDQKRRQFKHWNKWIYKSTKWSLIIAMLVGFIFI